MLSVGIQFRADYYQRDLQTNTVRAKGHAWVKKGDHEVWADEIEIDFTTNRAIANGHVRIRDTETEIWCRHADYNLNGEDAILEEATLVTGQMVLTGRVVRKISPKKFEIEEGYYTNCNLEMKRDAEAGQCPYDWKIYGRGISATLEEYAHISDGIFYAKQLPLLYTPYLIVPIKTKRGSGLLMPTFSFVNELGNGATLPTFLVLGSWHDMTLTPTYYTRIGYHVELNYRYVYSANRSGTFDIFVLERRFSQNRDNPLPADESQAKSLGFIGEWALNLRNIYAFGERGQSRQILRLVSDPFYTRFFGGGLGPESNLSALRSQLSLTLPSEERLFTMEAQYYQSLLVARDSGVDRGPVGQVPSVTFSKKTTSPIPYFSYEVDSQFTHFYRSQQPFDPVPATKKASDLEKETLHVDPNPHYHEGDYIREGSRLRVEPRLVANPPMPPGFQFQPVLKGGSLVYHFAVPSSKVIHREYLETELPFSIYLSKTFDTSFAGYEKVKHVFQPRFIYASSIHQAGTENHPFFFVDRERGLSNPRFDILDQLTPFQYMRFELINRFLRKSVSSTERFFLLQLSEEFNLRTSDDDPRFSRRLGPVELLSELQVGPISAQLQANYQLEKAPKNDPNAVHEYDWSSSIAYNDMEGDRLRLNNRFSIRSDEKLTDKLMGIGWYKKLPTFFDLDGEFKYSLKRGELLGFRLGFLFFSKPRSCWALNFNIGRDDLKDRFANVIFRFSFGNPAGGTPPVMPSL